MTRYGSFVDIPIPVTDQLAAANLVPAGTVFERLQYPSQAGNRVVDGLIFRPKDQIADEALTRWLGARYQDPYPTNSTGVPLEGWPVLILFFDSVVACEVRRAELLDFPGDFLVLDWSAELDHLQTELAEKAGHLPVLIETGRHRLLVTNYPQPIIRTPPTRD